MSLVLKMLRTWSVVRRSYLTVGAESSCLANTLALGPRENRLGVIGTRGALTGIKLLQVLEQSLPQLSPLCDSTGNSPNQIYDWTQLNKHEQGVFNIVTD